MNQNSTVYLCNYNAKSESFKIESLGMNLIKGVETNTTLLKLQKSQLDGKVPCVTHSH